KDLLINKSVEKRKGNRKWEILFRARTPDLFKSPKIILRQTGDRPICVIDEDQDFFCINSLHVLKPKDISQKRMQEIEVLCNSKLLEFFYQEISQEKGRALAEIKPNRLRSLIMKFPQDNMLLNLRLDILNSAIDPITSYEKLNNYVFKLYGLSYKDVLLIEPEFSERMTEQEYNSLEIEFEDQIIN